MIFFTDKKDISMLQERKGKKVKETCPRIDIPALRFADESSKLISKNTTGSISFTTWLINNRPGIRIHVSYFICNQVSYTDLSKFRNNRGIFFFFLVWILVIFSGMHLSRIKIKTNYVVN